MTNRKTFELLWMSLLIVIGSVSAQEANWDATISASNPINWYKFNETDNTCVDHGSGGNNGTYGLVTLGQPGLLRNALAAEFTGVQGTAASQVDFGGLGVLTGDWTAEYIVMKKGTDNQALHDGGAFSIRIQGWGDTRAGFTYYGVADYFFNDEPGKISEAPVGTWVHLVFRRTGSGMELFIDGILVGKTGNSVDFPRAFIGRNRGNAISDTFKGLLDEVVVFNRALSDTEIVQHFASAQLTAVFPFPENGAILVDKTTNLEWTYGAYVPSGYDVYFGSEPNALNPEWYGNKKILDKQNVTTVDPSPSGMLEPARTYYWRVDSYEPNAPGPDILHPGIEWSFTTAPDVPVLLDSPDDVVVAAGSTVSLKVIGLNQTDYAWYKSADPATDTPADDSPVGGNTDTLILSSVQLTDEGYYFCVISNVLGSLTSDSALVMIERMVAQWKFENNLDDELGVHDAVGKVFPRDVAFPDMVEEPNYVEGIVGGGSAVILNGTDQLIEVPYSRMLNQKNFTITAWVKPATTDTGYRAVVSIRDEVLVAPTYQAGLILYATDGEQWQFWTGGAGWQGNGTNLLSVSVADDTWTHLAISFEATQLNGVVWSGTKRLYINGRLAAINTAGLYRLNNRQALQIGAGQNEDVERPLHDYFFGGAIDDVAVYNYTLDGLEVGRLYHDVSGETFCVDTVGLQYDWNGNCKVDIEDFAVFAATWMNCRLVPDCLP